MLAIYLETMPILHICNNIMGSRVHLSLYDELYQKGIEQIIYAPCKKRYNTCARNYSIIFSEPLSLYHKYFQNRKNKFLLDDLLSKIDYKKIELSHATTLFCDGRIALDLFKLYDIPYIVAIRSTDIWFFKKFWHLRRVGLEVLRCSKKVVFISDSIKNRFLLMLSKYNLPVDFQYTVIYNGIDNFWIDNLYNKVKCEKKTKYRLLYVGTFIKRKNVKLLIKSFKKIAEYKQGLELVLVGAKGTYLDYVKREASRYGNIEYLGAIKDKKLLLDVYRSCDLFVLPSINETFGLVYLEALSQKLPIIGVVNEGIYGVLQENCLGFFLDSVDMDSVCSAIISVLSNLSKYNLPNNDFFESFRWKNISEKYFVIYKQILEK